MQNDCLDIAAELLVPYVSLNAGNNSTPSSYRDFHITTTYEASTHLIQWFMNNSSIQVQWSAPTFKTVHEDAAMHALDTVSNTVYLDDINAWIVILIEESFFPIPHPIYLVRCLPPTHIKPASLSLHFHPIFTSLLPHCHFNFMTNLYL